MYNLRSIHFDKNSFGHLVVIYKMILNVELMYLSISVCKYISTCTKKEQHMNHEIFCFNIIIYLITKNALI